jgi:hypothetical protein
VKRYRIVKDKIRLLTQNWRGLRFQRDGRA